MVPSHTKGLTTRSPNQPNYRDLVAIQIDENSASFFELSWSSQDNIQEIWQKLNETEWDS